MSGERHTLRLGFSTCPNDIFAFHGLMERRVDLRGLEYELSLMDVQELNEQLACSRLDISKASFHAALHLCKDYGVLRVGAALGFGVGPLLLSRVNGVTPQADSLVLCPGAWTTATMLFRCLYPKARRVEHRVFSDLMPALQRGEADFAVVIHEGRFTYQDAGLHRVADLGEAWENLTHGPIPLGGILARQALGADIHERFCSTLRDSIQYAEGHRDEVFQSMRRYAQEMDESVIWSHVELYVNEQTLALNETGVHALDQLGRFAQSAGLIPMDSHLTVLG